MRIPWSSIIAYGERYCLDPDEIEEFTYHIRKMDTFLLNRLEAKEKAKNK
jgi:hypothetical protein